MSISMYDDYKLGTCTEMCPKKEVQLRTKHNLLDPLEKSLGLCVKAYSRSAAGAKETQPCDLRTPDICVKTAEFLINKIIIPQALDNSKYAFVLDRLRSIRQELVIQNINDERTIRIYEICVKFLLYSGYELCESSATRVFKFDSRQNHDQLQSCLKTLIHLYTELEVRTSDYLEMICVYLLLDLDSIQPMIWLLNQKSPELSHNIQILKAIHIIKNYRERNFIAIFRNISDLNAFPLMAFHFNLPKVYRVILDVMSSAYGVPSCQYPMKNFCQNFAVNQNECLSLIRTHLKINMEEDESSYIPFRKNTLISNPPTSIQKMSVVDDHLKGFNRTSLFSFR
ncbi:uncharacterized protein [Lepeophtheirus salmonis]|uniref:uncharacterized protein n=1 Tax=Lepeophtheirus salmonis TaxID=72036 RepID=UPI001AE5F1B8|nr:SAC3 family protein C-like [Lepeophtheirus salmonis]